MNPIAKWAAIAAGGVAGVAVLLLSTVYIGSEYLISRSWPMPKGAFHVAQNASAARGEHLASTLGCTSCHGAKLEGEFLDFIPGSKVYGANLVHLAETFSDSDFEHAIRHGLRPDGSSVPVMPANQYANLTNDETGSLIAYIRSIKSEAVPTPSPSYGLLVRGGLVMGKFGTEADNRPKYNVPIDLGPQFAQGRHIAMVSCGECHGSDLAGVHDDMVQTPDLMVATAYDRADFEHFMKTGKAAGNRELELMSMTARLRFSHFSDAEVKALYDYLSARGEKLAEN